MSDFVLDSSAVLALMLAEPGAEVVGRALPGACLSAVNLAEVMSKLIDRGMPAAAARAAAELIGVRVIPFGTDQACETAALRDETRKAGLSLGDRACLALARSMNARVLTADGAWAGLTGFDIVMIRGG